MRILFIIFFFLLVPSVLAEYHPCQDVFPGYQYTEKIGTLPHYEAYKIDPITEEKVVFGFCFYSHEILKQDSINPMEIFISLDLEGNIVDFRIAKADVYKPYLLFDTEWPLQIIGKSIDDPWEYDEDIEAFLPKHDKTVNTAKRFLQDVVQSSRDIANLYLTEEVKEKTVEYLLHTQQVQQLRNEQRKTDLLQKQKKPSQDFMVQFAIDEKIQALEDQNEIKKEIRPVENAITGSAVVSSFTLSRASLFWVIVFLSISVFFILLYLIIRRS